MVRDTQWCGERTTHRLTHTKTHHDRAQRDTIRSKQIKATRLDNTITDHTTNHDSKNLQGLRSQIVLRPRVPSTLIPVPYPPVAMLPSPRPRGAPGPWGRTRSGTRSGTGSLAWSGSRSGAGLGGWSSGFGHHCGDALSGWKTSRRVILHHEGSGTLIKVIEVINVVVAAVSLEIQSHWQWVMKMAQLEGWHQACIWKYHCTHSGDNQ